MESAGSLIANQSTGLTSSINNSERGEVNKSNAVIDERRLPEYGSFRVLYDARKIFDGGIGTYTRNVLNGLIANGIRPTVLISQNDWRRLEFDYSELMNQLDAIFDESRGYSLSEYFYLAAKINNSGCDIYHSPHYTLPYGIKIPSVITVHDLIHYTHPQKFYYPFLSRILIKSAVKRARRVITVSKASANQLMQHIFNQHENKVIVIENSIGTRWLSNANERIDPQCTVKYFFSLISTDKPHKGIVDLLYAYQLYQTNLSKYEQPIQLILAGQAFSQQEKFIRLVNTLNLAHLVTIKGVVSEAELTKLYSESYAVVTPSLAEGFGLTMLEAHAQGKFVIYRPVAALDEIALSCDIRASDFSIAALSVALQKASSNMPKQQDIIERFKQQYNERFDSVINAQRLLELYCAVLSEIPVRH